MIQDYKCTYDVNDPSLVNECLGEEKFTLNIDVIKERYLSLKSTISSIEGRLAEYQLKREGLLNIDYFAFAVMHSTRFSHNSMTIKDYWLESSNLIDAIF